MLTTKELKRQFFHMGVGLVTAVLVYYEILSSLAIFLLIVVGILISILSKRIRIPGVSLFLDHMERDDVRKTFPGKGPIFFFVGVLLVLKLFSKDIAMAAIMILTFGDSVSHLVGARIGKIKNIFNGQSKKLFEGTIAGTVAGFLGALIFVSATEALLAAFSAMAAEVVEIELNQNQLDDNVIVPLVAGTIIFLLRTYLA